MKRTLVAAALVVVFTMALAVPVSAISHDATYNWDGSVSFEQQAGHYCNTGAEVQQTIDGQGTITKAKTVDMSDGVITFVDDNDWVTAPDAIRNLTVTTGILLCAPAKHVYEDDGVEYAYNPDWNGWDYDDLDNVENVDEDFLGVPPNANLDASDALTDQIWAVQVSPDPGYSGELTMAMRAQYSDQTYADRPDAGDRGHADAWLYNPYDGESDWTGYETMTQGPNFKGNLFEIEQFSRTSQGTHRRYIDISSPWSHGYMEQDMTVVGMSEVWEAFEMNNLTPGDSVATLWYDMF